MGLTGLWPAKGGAMRRNVAKGLGPAGLAVAVLAMPPSARAQAPVYYPVFCQGIAIDQGDNRMFVSEGFAYPLRDPPQSAVVQEGTAAQEFAREVRRLSDKTLLDQSCLTRPTADELNEVITTTRAANAGSWVMVPVSWLPAGARRLAGEGGSSDVASETPTARPAPPATPAAADRAARAEEQRRAAAAAREAERARQAAAAEEARLAKARADQAAREEAAAATRAANARQAAQAEAQRLRFEAEKRDFDAKMRAYQDGQKAYAAAVARHQAEVQAAADARKKWEEDVAACQGGDVARCAPPR